MDLGLQEEAGGYESDLWEFWAVLVAREIVPCLERHTLPEVSILFDGVILGRRF